MDLEKELRNMLQVSKRVRSGFEEDSTRYQSQCLMLEVEVKNLKKKIEELQRKIRLIKKIVSGVCSDDDQASSSCCKRKRRRPIIKNDNETESESESSSERVSKNVYRLVVNSSDDEVSKRLLHRIGRNKRSGRNWSFEAEMLADFSEYPELCLRAVCALYRQQTNDEKAKKLAVYANKRGFSKSDALRASKLARFLTSGHPHCDLNKTVEQVKQYDSEALKYCNKLAFKYSNQLFQIYTNKEDRYFSANILHR